ncbi:hypothetical protein V6Z11_D01G089000 [Gossypium hirsutum]
MTIRDFNVILSSNEKIDDLSSGKRCPHFGEFVDFLDLHDLGFRGPPFTWHKFNLFQRLDRALGNKAWISYFPNSLITHISKIKFDHRPFLLNLNSDFALPRGRPFPFLVGWVKHPEFGDLVKDRWDFQGNMSASLAKFTANFKDWNKTTYGHITSHKINLIYKLLAIQKQTDLSGSNRLAFIEMDITDEKHGRLLKEILNDFCELSGHKVNPRKTNVLFSKGVDESMSLSKVWTLLRENLIWSVGDGNKIRCWTGQWIPNVGPLINYLPASANVNTDCLL